MAIEPLRNAAIHQLAKLSQVDSHENLSDIERLRSDGDQARLRVEDLKTRLAVVKARIPETKKLIARIKGQIPGASARAVTAEQPVCEICEVPIDRALAEGCGLSRRLPDPVAAKRRVEHLEQERIEESNRLQHTLTERDGLVKELHPAQTDYESMNKTLRAAERMRDARTDAWYKSRRLIDDVDRLDALLVEQEQLQSGLTDLEHKVQEKRDQVGSFRDAHATTFNILSRFFDIIVRELIGPSATGRVSLDGNGIRPSVELGGERSTAAIDSLKVIAFDLAGMCMSIEGRAHQPAFLIHDSPREADLGLSIFHRLFKVVRSMENMGEQPLFRYVITSTTSPPPELATHPWLAATLGGEAGERLLQRDL